MSDENQRLEKGEVTRRTPGPAEEWLELAGGRKVVGLAAGLTCLGTLAYVLLLPAAQGPGDRQLLTPLILLPVSLLSLLLLWRGRAAIAYHVLLWGVLAGVTVTGLLVAGLRTASLFAYPVLVVGAMALGPRIVLAVGAVTIAAVIGIGTAGHLGLLPAPRPASAFIVAFVYVLVLLILTGIASTMVREQRRWRDKEARTGRALAENLRALRRQHDFQEALMRAQSDAGLAMFIIEAGRVIHANDAACRMFGYTAEEMLALPSYLALAHPDERERIAQNHQRRLRGEQFENSYRFAFLTRSGERREGELTAAFMPGETPRVLVVVADVTERKRTEALLEESAQRLREAQRIGRVGSWELDVASGRMSWSDELYRIYERQRHEFGGTWSDLLNLVHPGDLELMKQTWRQAAQAEGNVALRHRILTPDGRVKHLHIRFEVFRDARGRPLRALGTAQDITEQVRAREQIERLNAELERRVQERTAELTAANRELESFAYSISHDLRAPLRGIDGFSHLLAEEYAERLDDQGRGYLERVRRAAQRMGALIDDILELSRVTRQDMRRVEVDLSQIATELAEEHARTTPGQRAESLIAPGCRAFGDPQLLRVLMQNLLENAWKYSARQPAPRVEFGQESIDGQTAFFVRDNGVGFDMRYAERLFTPFQRLHRPEEFEGTGIGLATVARIVRRHGGRVWAEAKPDQGATFRFTLARNHE